MGTSERTDSGGRSRGWWRLAAAVWWTVVFVVEFVLRTLWVRDKRTAVSGGAGVELWPRKLATAKLRIDDMKAVKETVAHAVTFCLYKVFSFFLFFVLYFVCKKLLPILYENFESFPNLKDEHINLL